MKRGTPRHPKVLELSSLLGIPVYSCVGLMEMLWHFTAEFSLDGGIGKFSNNAIGAALQWDGNHDKLIEALVSARLLDECICHRLRVHDWKDHADQTVKRVLATRNQLFAPCYDDASTVLASSKLPLPKPIPMPLPEPETSNKDNDKELTPLVPPGGDLNSRNRSGDPLPLAVSSLTSETKPKRTNKTKKKSPAKGGPTWEAYSAGYLQRYGVEPRRNQKVNSLCCQLVDRLGAEEAPLVAGYYPTTQNGYYVQRGHILDCLVADAEKVRTEWATGKTIYQRQAREQDRLGATGELWREIMAENEIKEREKQNAK